MVGVVVDFDLVLSDVFDCWDGWVMLIMGVVWVLGVVIMGLNGMIVFMGDVVFIGGWVDVMGNSVCVDIGLVRGVMFVGDYWIGL